MEATVSCKGKPFHIFTSVMFARLYIVYLVNFLLYLFRGPLVSQFSYCQMLPSPIKSTTTTRSRYYICSGKFNFCQGEVRGKSGNFELWYLLHSCMLCHAENVELNLAVSTRSDSFIFLAVDWERSAILFEIPATTDNFQKIHSWHFRNQDYGKT